MRPLRRSMDGQMQRQAAKVLRLDVRQQRHALESSAMDVKRQRPRERLQRRLPVGQRDVRQEQQRDVQPDEGREPVLALVLRAVLHRAVRPLEVRRRSDIRQPVARPVELPRAVQGLPAEVALRDDALVLRRLLDVLPVGPQGLEPETVGRLAGLAVLHRPLRSRTIGTDVAGDTPHRRHRCGDLRS